ncbi:uncharacterized protein PAC_01585 [Phialocephala subalpina]|uniref:Uncharacterized protein n=1 Tax=Phialocephala subalpina TaxID=576137 RepID=A0A1L7WG13_9HELO|nr:uncharacterized protein PAC_01585 [Phialocephala subalpina]
MIPATKKNVSRFSSNAMADEDRIYESSLPRHTHTSRQPQDLAQGGTQDETNNIPLHLLHTNLTCQPPNPSNGHDEHAEAPAAAIATRRIRKLAPLKTFDVFSLIVNKMIGTGIFTAPVQVLLATQSKQLALGLWALGFIYTIMSMFLYLDYAVFLPYTGGELVYLDEISSADTPPKLPEHHGSSPGSPSHQMNDVVDNGPSEAGRRPSRASAFKSRRRCSGGFISRIFGDGLLAYIVYAFLFIAVFNSATNCMLTAREILVARDPSTDQDRDLIRFIGVTVLSVICLLQVISARAGRTTNRIFAIAKLLMLFVLFCAGCKLAVKNMGNTNFTQKGTISKLEGCQAVLIILYSFEGWENANFVAGEIDFEHNQNTLRDGFGWAVGLIGGLYFLLNVVFLCTVSYDDVHTAQMNEKHPHQYSYPAAFFGDAESVPAQRAWAILIAISSAGNILIRPAVKQAISQANVFPWSSWFKRDFLFKTIEGGGEINEIAMRTPSPVADTNHLNSGTQNGGVVERHAQVTSRLSSGSNPFTEDTTENTNSRTTTSPTHTHPSVNTESDRMNGPRTESASQSERSPGLVRNNAPVEQPLPRAKSTANEQPETYRFTPIGGLALEWVSTVFGIAFSAVIPATLESVSLPGNIQTYSHCFFLILLGFGVLRLSRREDELGRPMDTSEVWRISKWNAESRNIALKILTWIIVLIYCGFNGFILYVSGHYASTGADNPNVSVTGYVYPSATFGLCALAFLYYSAIFLGLGDRPRIGWYRSLVRWVKVTGTINKASKYDFEVAKVYRFGSRRTITFTLGECGSFRELIYWALGGKLERNPLGAMYQRLKKKTDFLWRPVWNFMNACWSFVKAVVLLIHASTYIAKPRLQRI